MHRDRKPFEAAIAADPADDTTRLVFADWLDEQGEAAEAAAVRAEVACHAVGAKPDNLSDLVGKILTAAVQVGDAVFLTDSRGRRYRLYHEQDCCEYVTITGVEGRLEHLVGSPITKAEQDYLDPPPTDPPPEYPPESETWTNQTLATVRGEVVIRWHGTSNGYYGETPTFGVMDD